MPELGYRDKEKTEQLSAAEEEWPGVDCAHWE